RIDEAAAWSVLREWEAAGRHGARRRVVALSAAVDAGAVKQFTKATAGRPRPGAAGCAAQGALRRPAVSRRLARDSWSRYIRPMTQALHFSRPETVAQALQLVAE